MCCCVRDCNAVHQDDVPPPSAEPPPVAQKTTNLGMDLDALAKRSVEASPRPPRSAAGSKLQQPPFKAVRKEPDAQAQAKEGSTSKAAAAFKLSSVPPPPATPPISKIMHLDSKEIVRGRRPPQETKNHDTPAESPMKSIPTNEETKNSQSTASKEVPSTPPRQASLAGHTPKALRLFGILASVYF